MIFPIGRASTVVIRGCANEEYGNKYWMKLIGKIESRREGIQNLPTPSSIRKASKRCAAESNEATTAEKKVKGRKRHIGVDIEGHLLHVEMSAANIHDTMRGGYVIESMKEKHPTIQAISADAGYRGNTVDYAEILLETPVHISKKIQDTFAVLPKRWVVERTLAWMNNDRRLSKDYEIIVRHSENMVRLSMLRRTLRRFCSFS